MRGRMKARRETTITLAHQTEAMRREHRLKPLDKYLRRSERKEGTDPGVLSMLAAMRAKGVVTIKERGADGS